MLIKRFKYGTTLKAGRAVWVFHKRPLPELEPVPIDQQLVSFQKIPVQDGNIVAALLTSINEIRATEGKELYTERSLFGRTRGQPQNEEQLAQKLGTHGAYRLAVIDPRQDFRVRLVAGCPEEGEVVYIFSDGKAHWDGVRLISSYERYEAPAEGAVDPEADSEIPPDLHNCIWPAAYSEYQRNLPHLEIPTTRIRTWAGGAAGAAAEGGIPPGPLRTVPRKYRAGERGVTGRG